MLKISLSETPSEEKLTTKDKGSVFKRLAGFFFAVVVAVFAVYIGAQCVAGGVYLKNMFEQMTTKSKSSVLNRLTGFFFGAVVAVLAVLIGGTNAKAQNVPVTGSVPSGPASDQILRLTLRDAISMALRLQPRSDRKQRKRQDCAWSDVACVKQSAATGQRRHFRERRAKV